MLSEHGDGRRAALRLLATGAALAALPAAAARALAAQVGLRVRAGITGSNFTEPPVDHPTRRLADLAGFRPGPPPVFTDFGGIAGAGGTASGFFAVERDGDRWWLRDPAGGRFVSIGLNSVDPRRGGEASRVAYRARFGSDAAWANTTTAMLRGFGINTAGSWSQHEMLAATTPRIAYCPNWSFLANFGKELGRTRPQAGHVGFAHDAVPVFDPGFAIFCDRHAAKLTATARDPWLIGHFTDNELPLGDKMLDAFLAAPTNDPAHVGARRWLAGRDPSAIDDAMREAFRAHVIERYYSIVIAAIRRHDPNHLILGTRFYGSEKDSEAAFRAAGRHVDIVSVNVYHEWTPNIDRMRRWAEWSGRPVLISEYYAKGADVGLSNRGGAGWTVATQAERGLFYQNFVLGLIESGVCVGWHWHRYMDNPVPKRPHPWDGGGNKGLVALDYQPYAALAEAMRELNQQVQAVAAHFDRRHGIA